MMKYTYLKLQIILPWSTRTLVLQGKYAYFIIDPSRRKRVCQNREVGWPAAGIHLNERGRKQAEALGEALKDVPITAIYSSPLERAMETAAPIANSRNLKITQDPDLMDTNIGKWQGKSLALLRLKKEWKIVQSAPSRFQFPEGEFFLDLQTRIANVLEGIIKKHNKPKDIIAVVFHADPIKLAVSHFLGLPLDHFQNLAVTPAHLPCYMLEMPVQTWQS